MTKKTEKIIKPDPVRINAPADKGLTPEQVSQRLADGLDNKPVESPSKSVKEIISENVFTYRFVKIII